jgi:AcrR family transcriptional regulator
VSSAENAAGIEVEIRWAELIAEAYEDGVERLSAAVEAAAKGEDAWEAKISAGLAATLSFLAADPPLARQLVEALAVPRPAGSERERALARLAEALRPLGRDVSEETLRLLAGGLESHVSGRVLAGETRRLPEDHDLLLGFILTPLQAVDPRSSGA